MEPLYRHGIFHTCSTRSVSIRSSSESACLFLRKVAITNLTDRHLEDEEADTFLLHVYVTALVCECTTHTNLPKKVLIGRGRGGHDVKNAHQSIYQMRSIHSPGDEVNQPKPS